MTYRQINNTLLLDGGSKWTTVFIVSDKFDELLSETFTYCDIFALGDTSTKTNQDEKYVESELKFSTNDAEIVSFNDAEAINFVLAALNPLNIRYVALYHCDESGLANISNRAFYGLVNANESEEDAKHLCENYSENLNNLSNREFSAAPFTAKELLSISVKTLCIGNTIDDELKISDDWISSNVSDKPAWFRYDSDNTHKVIIPKLVSLNKGLRVLADNLTARLDANGITMSFKFEGGDLPFKLLPARFTHGHPIGLIDEVYFCWSKDPIHDNIIEWDQPAPFVTYVDDAQQLKLSPDDIINEEDDIWVDFKTFKNYPDVEYEDSNADNYRVWKADDLFDLVIGIGQGLNMLVEIFYSSFTEITIRFINPKDAKKKKIRIQNMTKSGLSISAEENKGEPFAFSNAFYYVAEGTKEYLRTTEGYYQKNGQIYKDNEGKELLFTISPTLLHIEGNTVMPFNTSNQAVRDVNVYFPHNHIWDAGGTLTKKNRAGNTESIHNAIYMKVSKRTGQINAPDNYWTPASAIAFEIGSDEYTYNVLSSYLNKVQNRASEYLKIEKSLTIKHFNGFSENADGSANSWKNAKVNNYFIHNGIEYIITEVTFANQSNEVKIKAVNSSIYTEQEVPITVSEAYIPDFYIPDVDSESDINLDSEMLVLSDQGDLTGKIVELYEYTDPESMEKQLACASALPMQARGGEIWGRRLAYALEYFSDTERIKIKMIGEIGVNISAITPPLFPIYNWENIEIGAKLYLRYVGNNSNISDLLLTEWKEISEYAPYIEDTVIEIGTKTSAISINLNFIKHYTIPE